MDEITTNKNIFVEALNFFRLLLSNCLNWKIYCDDHSSLSRTFYSHLYWTESKNKNRKHLLLNV